jgi:inward rectifier potassium channel
MRNRPAPPSSHKPTSIRRVKVGKREVLTEGFRRVVFQDLFHYFMTITWPQLFATFAVFFLVFDTLFGCAYYLAPGCIANLNPPGFAGAFFFSVETLATVGYGVIRPIDGRRTLVLRAANLRLNVIRDASARLYMMRNEVTQEGLRIRRVFDLTLLRSTQPTFNQHPTRCVSQTPRSSSI